MDAGLSPDFLFSADCSSASMICHPSTSNQSSEANDERNF
jgi:hypothetical protein